LATRNLGAQFMLANRAVIDFGSKTLFLAKRCMLISLSALTIFPHCQV